jgi:hypothetical protein
VAGSKWNWLPRGLLTIDAVSQELGSLQACSIRIVRGVVAMAAPRAPLALLMTRF